MSSSNLFQFGNLKISGSLSQALFLPSSKASLQVLLQALHIFLVISSSQLCSLHNSKGHCKVQAKTVFSVSILASAHLVRVAGLHPACLATAIGIRRKSKTSIIVRSFCSVNPTRILSWRSASMVSSTNIECRYRLSRLYLQHSYRAEGRIQRASHSWAIFMTLRVSVGVA